MINTDDQFNISYNPPADGLRDNAVGVDQLPNFISFPRMTTGSQASSTVEDFKDYYTPEYQMVPDLPGGRERRVLTGYRLNDLGLSARTSTAEQNAAEAETVTFNTDSFSERMRRMNRPEETVEQAAFRRGRETRIGRFDNYQEQVSEITAFQELMDWNKRRKIQKFNEYMIERYPDIERAIDQPLTSDEDAILSQGRLVYNYRKNKFEFRSSDDLDSYWQSMNLTWTRNQSDLVAELMFTSPAFQGFAENFIRFGRDGEIFGDELTKRGLGLTSSDLGILGEIPDDVDEKFAFQNIPKWFTHEDSLMRGFSVFNNDSLPSSRLMLTKDPNFNLDETVEQLKESDYYRFLQVSLGSEDNIKRVTDMANNKNHFFYLANRAAIRQNANMTIKEIDEKMNWVRRNWVGFSTFFRDSFIASPDAVADIAIMVGTGGIGAGANLLKTAAMATAKTTTRQLAISATRRRIMQGLAGVAGAAPSRWGESASWIATKMSGRVARFAQRNARNKKASYFTKQELGKAFKRYATFELATSFVDEYGAAVNNQRILNRYVDDEERYHSWFSKQVITEGIFGAFIGVGVNRAFRVAGNTLTGLGNMMGMGTPGGGNKVTKALADVFQTIQLQGVNSSDRVFLNDISTIGLDAIFGGVDTEITTTVVNEDGKVEVVTPKINDHPLVKLVYMLSKGNPALLESTDIEVVDSKTGEVLKFKGPRVLQVVSNAVSKGLEAKRAESGNVDDTLTLEEAFNDIALDLIATLPEDAQGRVTRDSIRQAALATNAVEIAAIRLQAEKKAAGEKISLEEARKQIRDNPNELLVALSTNNKAFTEQRPIKDKDGNDVVDAAGNSVTRSAMDEVLMSLEASEVSQMFESTTGDLSDLNSLRPIQTEKAKKLREEKAKEPQHILEASKRILHNLQERASLSTYLADAMAGTLGAVGGSINNRLFEVTAENEVEVREKLADLLGADLVESLDFSEGYLQLTFAFGVGTNQSMTIGIGARKESGPSKKASLRITSDTVNQIAALFDGLSGQEIIVTIDPTAAQAKEDGAVDTGKDPEADSSREDSTTAPSTKPQQDGVSDGAVEGDNNEQQAKPQPTDVGKIDPELQAAVDELNVDEIIKQNRDNCGK